MFWPINANNFAKKSGLYQEMQGFCQKRPVHYNAFALFLLTESLLHMAEQKW
jgi:hypothetical protein